VTKLFFAAILLHFGRK